MCLLWVAEEVYSLRSQEMTNEERQEMKSQMTQCVEERRQLNTVTEDTEKKKLDLEIKLSKTLRDVRYLFFALMFSLFCLH